MSDCKPSCCGLEQKSVSVITEGHALYDQSCCVEAQPFAVEAGAMIERGQVVYFTGNDVSVTLDGTARDYPEIGTTPVAGSLAGVALHAVDNTAGDAGTVQFLTEARVFVPPVDLNGASVTDMKAAGLTVAYVYN